MNITSYTGFPSVPDIEFPPEDIPRLRVPDVGEGSVKVSSFAGFTKEEYLRAHLEELQLF